MVAAGTVEDMAAGIRVVTAVNITLGVTPGANITLPDIREGTLANIMENTTRVHTILVDIRGNIMPVVTRAGIPTMAA